MPISEVDPESDASTKGLRSGDVVIEVNSQTVATSADIETAVKKAQDAGRPSVLVTVKSGDQRRVVSVKMVNKKS